MAFRVHDNVIRGEIDNTRRGVVTGKIWVVGRDEPLELELAGDCWTNSWTTQTVSVLSPRKWAGTI